MAGKRLLNLIRIRHKALVWAMAAILLLFTAVSVSNDISNYHQLRNDTVSARSFELMKENKYYNHAYDGMSYQDYRDQQRYIYMPAAQNRLIPEKNNIGLFQSVLAGIVAFLFGLILASKDNLSGFNTILFSSGFKRRGLFKTRYLYGLAAVAVTTIVSVGIHVLGYYLFLPPLYVGLSALNVLGLILMNLELVVFLYTAGLVVGTFFASLFWMILFAVVGAWMGSGALSRLSISQTWRQLLPATPKSNDYKFLIGLTIVIVAVAIAYFVSQRLFQRISTENEHNILLIPNLRWVIIGYALLTLPYSFGNWLLYSYGLSYAILSLMILGFGFWWWYRERRAKGQAKVA
ncbi:MAG: ABC-2 transporter permease [Lactobacillus sp.]|jgi:hypothetical protein|nr:ABC-2 transporter permease [Lactobacillus sp.]